MKTRVCLTVDTEFSIGGAFAPPYAARPVGEPTVWCPVAGRSQGLGFLLHCLAEHGVRATFFIEALHRTYFGDETMRPAVEAIAAAGHELQLHLHPAWRVFAHPDWPARVAAQPRQDDLAGRTQADLVELIEAGCAAFAAWGLPRPTALRTGSLQHDWTVYTAMAAAGIAVGSNIGLAIHRSGDPRLALYAGCHELAGVRELPVLSYTDFRLGARRHLKSLTVQGCGWRETEHLLWAAHAAGLPAVVILTHPFEYIRGHDAQFQGAHTNGLTQRRLRRLCAFLARHADCFESSGLAAAATTWPSAALGRNPLLGVPAWAGAQRLVENRLAGCWPAPGVTRAATAGARA